MSDKGQKKVNLGNEFQQKGYFNEKKCAFRQQIYNKGLRQNIHHPLTFAAGGPRAPVLVHWVGWLRNFKNCIVLKKEMQRKIKILASGLGL